MSQKSITAKIEADDVFLGLLVTHGNYIEGKEYYDTDNIRDNIYELMDKRHNIQLIYSTWILPNEMEIQWEQRKCRFVSIAGLVLNKKK